MTIDRGPDKCRGFLRYKAAIVVAGFTCLRFASTLPAADDAPIASLVEQMSVAGKSYDPQQLLKHGMAGTIAVMDEVFPETAADVGDRNARIGSLVEQLGNSAYERREEAAAALYKIGPKCLGVLRQSVNDKDVETRLRVRELIAAFESRSSRRTQNMNLGLQAYVAKLEDVDCRREIARRVNKALESRLDLTPRQETLKICLDAMTHWPSNRIHDELLPLLQLDDPAPAVFAMREISGRTGNNYVSSIHMGAIACGRPELVKFGFRSMPGPVWDETNKPKIRAVLERLFDGSDVSAELIGDADFMDLAAFVAARDYHIAGARRWLLAQINSGIEQKSLRAMSSLSDTYYMNDPLYPELLAALKPHLKSEDPIFRAASIRTLGVYRGDAVVPLLLAAFADPVKEVWRAAGERLQDQHGYFAGGSSPIPKLLENARRNNDDPAFRSRAEHLLKHLQQNPSGYLQWPE